MPPRAKCPIVNPHETLIRLAQTVDLEERSAASEERTWTQMEQSEGQQQHFPFSTPNQQSLDEPVRCPKCSSTQVSANRKGFSVGKAVGWGVLLGPLGWVAGAAGASQLKVTCLRCGHSWLPGQVGGQGRSDPLVRPESSAKMTDNEVMVFWIIFVVVIIIIFNCS